jgi:hypothetical protein
MDVKVYFCIAILNVIVQLLNPNIILTTKYNVAESWDDFCRDERFYCREVSVGDKLEYEV